MPSWKVGLPTVAAGAVGALAVRDATQKKYTILRNFPVLGHARLMLTSIGPELRQYIVAANDEERPFTRDQRDWIYASSDGEPNTFGFGTDNDVEYTEGYPIIKHRTFADVAASAHPRSGEQIPLPPAKVLGAARGRRKAFRPNSVINVSGMSYGALSAQAVEALNRGAAIAGAMHNTGEGGLSPYHQKGADLVFQVGTSYFGVRDDEGRFDMGKLLELCEKNPVRAVEIKLSQGAKPGLGGLLPKNKISPEIAKIRGIPDDKDCASASRHTAFTDVDSMLDLVEDIADRTGLPVGIKSAVGDMTFWEHLVDAMSSRERGVDFVTIDGGEGGTGAAPLVFTDAISLPFRLGFSRVYRLFAEAGLTDDVMFIGSGKLGVPENTAVAFALGVDMVNVAREAMLSIGCIQAQKCHTGWCPTGVTSHHRWLTRGVDPDDKSERCARYLRSMRRELLKISGSVGVAHPSLITTGDIELAYGTRSSTPLHEVYGYDPAWGLPSSADCQTITDLMLELGNAEHDAAHATPESDASHHGAAQAH